MEQISIDQAAEAAGISGIPREVLQAAFERTKRPHIVADLAGGPYLVRPPTQAEVRKFMTNAGEAQKRYDELQNIALACTLYPPREELREIFAEYAGASSALGNLILEAGGYSNEAQLKKLVRG